MVFAKEPCTVLKTSPLLAQVVAKLGNLSKLEFEKYSDSRREVLQYAEIFKLVPSSVERVRFPHAYVTIKPV